MRQANECATSVFAISESSAIFQKYLTFNQDIYSYSTRHKTYIVVNRIRTKILIVIIIIIILNIVLLTLIILSLINHIN